VALRRRAATASGGRDGWPPFAIVGVPVAIHSTPEFDVPAYGVLITFAVRMVAVAYAAILNLFASELFLRPVLGHVGERLPPDFGCAPMGAPPRWLGVRHETATMSPQRVEPPRVRSCSARSRSST
jgi:hypothetical protein